MYPNQIKSSKARKATKFILSKLKNEGAYIYHISKWDSVYIKFDDNELRSVRIGDHSGRLKYRYKWNLNIGGETKIEMDRGVERFYFSYEDIEKLVAAIKQKSKDLSPISIDINKILSGR